MKKLSTSDLSQIGGFLKRADVMINSFIPLVDEESLRLLGENGAWLTKTILDAALAQLNQARSILEG